MEMDFFFRFSKIFCMFSLAICKKLNSLYCGTSNRGFSLDLVVMCVPENPKLRGSNLDRTLLFKLNLFSENF